MLILNKILIIKLRYIGDTLTLGPVVHSIKIHYPDAGVDVMVNRGCEEVISNNPMIGRLWTYDRKLLKNSPLSSLFYHFKLIKDLRSEKYDCVIDYSLGDRAAFLSYMTGASERISYSNGGFLSGLLMNNVIHVEPFMNHIVDFQLKALKLFGINRFKRDLSFFISDSANQRALRIFEEKDISKEKPVVVIHPGARGKLRQWPSVRFSHLADLIRDRFNANIILIGGPDESMILDQVQNEMGFPASFASNSLSISEMAALLKKCNLFIGNDSAPAHVAASVGCPSITLFGPTFPHMWKPLASKGDVIFKNVPCCGCRQEVCIRPEKQCMDLITVDEVMEKVENYL